MGRLRLALAAIGMLMVGRSVHGQTPAVSPSTACRAHAPEAAVRSAVAVDVILRVMRAESGGRRNVVSRKGAIGCMQIMPTTWVYLSPRYGLGADPYDARMNMIGGAMYLAELTRRFGLPGAFAAYNAGPGRYIRYAANGVPLPGETVAYAARLRGAAAPVTAAIPHIRWQQAQLFLDRAGTGALTKDVEVRKAAVTRDRAGTSRASITVMSAAPTMRTLFPLSTNAAPD